MITWMQKHKKWLVITIWISAIAFIGAGMVNWGSYGFGLNNDKVARVGAIDIHIPDYQRAYNEVFNEYSHIPQLGGMLDEAQAKQLGLPQIALQRVVQQAQLLNFAYDLGLSVSDEEVSNEIINAKVYVDKEGHFSHEIYKQALKERQMSPSEFEEIIRKSLLIQKIFSIMNLNVSQSSLQIPMVSVTPLEIAALEMADSVRDRLMVKSIPITQVAFSSTDDELKAFWEKNADNWKTPMEFHIEYIFVPFNAQSPSEEALNKHYEDFKSDYLDNDGHLMSMEQSREKLIRDVQKLEAQSLAKREYRDLKNGSKQGKILTLKDNERFFIKNGVDLVVADMKVAQVGQVLKPIEADEGFVTLKLLDKKESVNKSFDEAKSAVKEMYEHTKRKESLVKLAQESVKNFAGTDIGFIDRFYNGAILTLDTNQKMHFLSQVFGSQDKEGYVLFDDKVVLYRVLEQSSVPKDKENNITMIAKNIKYGAVLDTLAENLNKTYKTTIYIDVSK